MRGLINHRHGSSGGNPGDGGGNPGGGGGSGSDKILLSFLSGYSISSWAGVFIPPLTVLKNDNPSRFSIVSNSVQINEPGLYKVTGAVGLGADHGTSVTTTIVPSVLRNDLSTYFFSHIAGPRAVEPMLINALAGNRVSFGMQTNGNNISIIGVLDPTDPAFENQMTYFSIEHVPLS